MYGGHISGGSAATGNNIHNKYDDTEIHLYGGSITDGDIYTASSMTLGNVTCDIIRCVTDGMKITMTGKANANLSVETNVYLDLSGNTLTGNMSGEGTLYAYDSATDDYTCENAGRITGTVSCTLPQHFQDANTLNRYLTVADETGYTFHRFYLGITKMSIRPAATGVGYKALFAGSDVVKSRIDSYGYKLWLTEDYVYTASKTGSGFVSGKEVSLLLKNFDVANYGTVPVNGSVFLKLTDGTVIESATNSYTLQELMETVAQNVSNYNPEQMNALKEMVERFAVAMADWEIDSIRNYTEA